MAKSDVDMTGHADQEKRQGGDDGGPRNPVPFEPSRFPEIEDSSNNENQERKRGLHHQCHEEEGPPAIEPDLTEQITFVTDRLLSAQGSKSAEKSWCRDQRRLRSRISPIVESATCAKKTIDGGVRPSSCIRYGADREPVPSPNKQKHCQRSHNKAPAQRKRIGCRRRFFFATF